MLMHACKETSSLKRSEISVDFSFYLWKTYNWDAAFQIHYQTHDSSGIDSTVVEAIKWKDRPGLSNKETASQSFSIFDNQVGYMQIRDFNGNEKEIKTFFQESFDALNRQNASYLILDFRGHSGGADSYGEHLAKYFAKVPFKKLSHALWKITPEFQEAFERCFIPNSIRCFKPI